MLSSTWDEFVYDQNDLMKSDMCLVVDDADHIIGYDSKLACHRFSVNRGGDNDNSSGKLHRAFSIFMFDKEGKLLLQRRALDKLTFPGVWTNTCCSHQLYSNDKSEIDDEDSIRKGSVMGTIRAARRKLQHELGLETVNYFKDNDFKFLTRIKYHAIDKNSKHSADGKEYYYGESEVDYLIFLRNISDHVENLSIHPHPEEVSETRFVSKDELRDMLSDENTYQWSPWFRLIANKLLFNWWDNLESICPIKSNPFENETPILYKNWDTITTL